MAHLYLVPHGGIFEVGERVTLRGDEAHHAAKVGRMVPGESTLVGDGVGHIAQATVAEVTQGEVVLELHLVDFFPRATPEVWLVQALAKGDRDELAVQACTEMGVDCIIPWQSERSISRWSSDKAAKGVARWHRIATEATKQSLRPRVPRVSGLAKIEDLAELAATHQMIVLEPDAPVALSAFAPEGVAPVVLVVGPEGGISPGESARLREAGAQSYRLGSSVLRTSTAGMAALALVSVALGRW